jgi:[glutamine synthetase] adenylyltransferase / [glutamine synthetase]-adenylyl-L-tyrosine phosphorylase
MVTIPKLESYTTSELIEAGKISPAINYYLQLLEKKTINFVDKLRKKRNEYWLEAALAVVFQRQSAESVCHQWSLDTIEVLKAAWSHTKLDKEKIAIIAMGKLGAMELNLSSDIDLFFVSSDTVEKSQLKKVRQFIQIVSSATPFGYGHRIDLTIRPGGPNSNIISSLEQMHNHYGYHGETWERSALIRHSPLLGDPQLLNECSEFLTKFTYRKHLDLNLFSDLNLMRDRIRAHQIPTEELNIKFHPGGIRELELLVHALQLIHGGRHPVVQTRSTTQALQHLANKKLIDQQSADHLLDAYWFYRDLENRIHLLEDQHTYLVPKTMSSFINKEMITTFLRYTEETDALINSLLKPYNKGPQFITLSDLSSTYGKLDLDTPEPKEAWDKLIQIGTKSKTKDRDDMQKRIFLNRFVAAVANCNVDNAMAIFHLEKFIANSKAKTSLFALFNSYEELVEELAWIFSCSPLISTILIHRPELIDSFLLKSVEIDKSSEENLYISLQDHKLLSEVICASQFLRKRNIDDLTKTLSTTTDTIISSLLESLQTRFQAKIDILTLGKWAGNRMGLTSDLDFVFIRSEGNIEQQSKMARRFINFLQSPSSGQTLYSIDLRLRPSGNAGPLMSTVEELTTYLNTKGQAWEKQAYLMNRLFSSKETIPLFEPRPLSPEDTESLRNIQTQLLISGDDTLSLKKSRGGLLHTELTLQAACLHLGIFPNVATVLGLTNALSEKLEPNTCHAILANYMLLRTYQQLLILIGGSSSTPVDENQLELQKICKIIQNTPKVVVQHIKNTLNTQRQLLNTLDPLSSDSKLVI